MKWWTCDPASGEDRFHRCDECHGAPAADGGIPLREHQRANRCPLLPESEWSPGAPGYVGPCDRNGEDMAEGADYCPGAHARQPIATEAHQAREWWDRGQIRDIYADGLPLIVVQAINVAETARALWLAERERIRRIPQEGQ